MERVAPNVDRTIAICTSCDRSFLPAACLSLMSVIDVTPTADAFGFFIFLDESVGDDDVARARRFLGERYARIHLVGGHGIDLSRYDNRKRPNRAGYLRLHYHEYLDPAFTRIVHVDADMRVIRSMDDLVGLDLGPHPVAAVHELALYAQLRIHHERSVAGLPPHGRYFNAGLSIFERFHPDMQAGLAKAVDLLSDPHTDFLFEDQTALNAAFDDQWKPIDPRWNINDYLYRAGVESDPYLLHFTSTKPWTARRTRDLDEFANWYRHKTEHSPWPDFVAERTNNKDHGRIWWRRVRLRTLGYPALKPFLGARSSAVWKRDRLIASGRLKEVYDLMRREAQGEAVALDDPQGLFM